MGIEALYSFGRTRYSSFCDFYFLVDKYPLHESTTYLTTEEPEVAQSTRRWACCIFISSEGSVN